MPRNQNPYPSWIDDPDVNLVNQYDMPVNQFKASDFGVVAVAPRHGAPSTSLHTTQLQQSPKTFTIDGRLLPGDMDQLKNPTAPQLRVTATGKATLHTR
jgi:hypothetical protein